MESLETAALANRVMDRLLPGRSVTLSRSVFYLIALLLAAGAAWAALASVDVVVQARGRLVVEGEPVRVTPAEPGMAIEVAVQVGSRVGKGDVLLRLDPSRYASEAAQVEADVRALRAEIARLRESAAAAREALRLTADERRLTEKKADLIASQAKALAELVRVGSVPARELEQKEQERIEAQARLARLDAELKRGETDASLAERQAVEREARIEGLAARLAQLRDSEKQMTVTAPCAGTVTHLAVVHPGRVVGTSDPAVVINPDGRPLRALLKVPNPSMRRPQGGMKVKMRFDAFPYQDFGFLEGELLRIDPDADAEGNYGAWVSLDRDEVRGPKGTERLRAGLVLETDILVERRTVLDLLLKPFRRMGDPVRVAD
jgi:multidrug resistance efflux pump